VCYFEQSSSSANGPNDQDAVGFKQEHYTMTTDCEQLSFASSMHKLANTQHHSALNLKDVGPVQQQVLAGPIECVQ
jgi:hypothetical protein